MRLRLLLDFHPEIERGVVDHDGLTLRRGFYTHLIHELYFVIILDCHHIDFVDLLLQ